MPYDWATFSGKTFGLDDFAAYVGKLKWIDWKPEGITIHNTGAPTLAQWVEDGKKHDERIANLKSYYQGLGWHAGPHIFASRSHVTEFTSLVVRGVHSTCFNRTDIGIEMPGDFSAEPFDKGDGAMVRDTAVFVAATLFHALGLDPRKNGVLHFHRECARDHHACPGRNVVKSDFLNRVVARMGL